MTNRNITIVVRSASSTHYDIETTVCYSRQEAIDWIQADYEKTFKGYPTKMRQESQDVYIVVSMFTAQKMTHYRIFTKELDMEKLILFC